MIKAVIFDMDGTLLNSEYLKALSYGRALERLTDGELHADRGAEAFKAVVGRSRKEVCEFLVHHFGLGYFSETLAPQYGVDEAWQVIAKVRGEIYNGMLDQPGLIWDCQWPYNIALLRDAKRSGRKVGLATMSGHDTADKILDILGVRDFFECILTVDDIEKTKPDPEIYLRAAALLDVRPTQCLVIEDSPSGVKAGIAAGMHVIAVSTPFTEQHLLEMKELDRRWLVTDPEKTTQVVHEYLEHLGSDHLIPQDWPTHRAYFGDPSAEPSEGSNGSITTSEPDLKTLIEPAQSN